MASIMGEATSSPPPSTSIPSLPRSCTYHVFLSFRGVDTRKGFTDHLCASLGRKGIKTFRDDKDLESGEVISVELLKAIEESMFAITVISTNYASSAWCLDELQKIIECRHKHGLYVVPVFYGVVPSHVRYQKGSFEEAFRRHEQRFGQDNERVKRWRDALAQVASYSGWDSRDQREAELVERIAQHIYTKLNPKLPSCTENLIGISSRVEEVTRLIGIGLNDVRFIGIWGMGGIGKTTIARVVYEAIESEFQVSCFLANVREISETNGLVQIQKDLVGHSYMNISTSTFNNVYDGKRTIRSSLCNKKVLLVLDDVSDMSHLENLAGEKDWFGVGSRVIITTRDIHLLNTHEVYGTYKVECLVQNEALHFFSLKAFKQDQPKEGYLEMSHEVVEYTGGLPLALEVLGSFLCQRTVDIWRSAIIKIKSAPHSKILDALKISYEGLDSAEKNIFLDIACFFKGMNKDDVTDILEKCGYNPRIEIDVLMERSLVTINWESNQLDMHDLLQEMGRDIVIQESPNDPGKRSRLWSKEHIDIILTQNKGTEAIQSIVVNQLCYEEHWKNKAFSNINQLKFLSLNGVTVPIHLSLPSSLKVLHWDLCPLETLHLADQQYELVEIKMPRNYIVQLWHGKKFLEKLKYMDLSFSWRLKQTPDLSGVPILETLVLTFCSNLTNIHPSLIQHKNLVVLNLSSCRSLETLPSKLQMSSLKELILDLCTSFTNLPEFGECMKHLSRLSLEGTAVRELPTSLGSLVGLLDLNISRCEELTRLPDSIHGLKSLKTLNVSGCPNLHGLPHFLSTLPYLSSLGLRTYFLTEESFLHDFGHFLLLTDLDLSYNNFVWVPISIHEHPKLRRLWLVGCEKLRFLPELPSSIRELTAWGCESLNTSNLNLSEACRAFALNSQDRGEVLQMVISGRRIPSWFVHQQEGNCVLVQVPHNFHQNGRLGIVLCFLLRRSKLSWKARFHDTFHLAIGNGDRNRIITGSVSPGRYQGHHLCIFCMTNDYSSEEIPQVIRFELSFKGNVVKDAFKILSSAACWVHIEDIEDLNKSEERETKRPEKRKRRGRRGRFD